MLAWGSSIRELFCPTKIPLLLTDRQSRANLYSCLSRIYRRVTEVEIQRITPPTFHARMTITF